MFAALWCRRCYSSVRRTVPYVTKGQWKLPTLNSEQTSASKTRSASEVGAAPTSPSPHEWGSRVSSDNKDGPVVNVPSGWRKLRTIPQWKKQMFALKEKFPDGWKPPRRISRDEMNELRAIKAARPQISLNALGDMFRISPEAVRRIVKSKWRADPATQAKLQERWQRRGVRLESPRVKPRRRPPQRLQDPGNRLF